MLDEAGTRALRATLRREYGLNVEGGWARMGGLSSQNFRFEAGRRLWVVKHFGHTDPRHFEKLSGVFHYLEASAYPTPFPKATLAGARFYVDLAQAVGVLPFWTGHTLHQGSFAPNSVTSAARMVRRLHLLEVPTDLARLLKRHTPAPLGLEHFYRAKSLLISRLEGAEARGEDLVRRAIAEKEIFLLGARNRAGGLSDEKVLVHGDCHNENFLFDETDRAQGLLDFDLCRLGHPLEDVIKFIDFSFFNSMGASGAEVSARAFLEAYGGDRRVQANDLRRAVHHHAEQTALSFHLEHLFLSGAEEVSGLIERDISKVRAFRTGDDALSEALLGGRG